MTLISKAIFKVNPGLIRNIPKSSFLIHFLIQQKYKIYSSCCHRKMPEMDWLFIRGMDILLNIRQIGRINLFLSQPKLESKVF